MNRFELDNQEFVFKGINYCELTLFSNIKDCEVSQKHKKVYYEMI